MAKNNNLTDFLTGVADSIRTKKGTSEVINPQDFESEIESIQTGITPTGSINITENGTVDVTNYATAVVTVPEHIPQEISTEQGMTDVLIAENVGKAYKYTGTTTENYINGDIYIVEDNT